MNLPADKEAWLATQDKTPAEGPKRLEAAHLAWIEAGSPLVDRKIGDKLAKECEAALAAVTRAEEAADVAREKLSATVEKLVRCAGKGRLNLGGKLGTQIPMARGKSLFLRAENLRGVKRVR